MRDGEHTDETAIANLCDALGRLVSERYDLRKQVDRLTAEREEVARRIASLEEDRRSSNRLINEWSPIIDACRRTYTAAVVDQSAEELQSLGHQLFEQCHELWGNEI